MAPVPHCPYWPYPRRDPGRPGERKQGSLPGRGAVLKSKDSEEVVGALDSATLHSISKTGGIELKQHKGFRLDT